MGTIRPTRNSALAFTHANDHGRIFLIGEAVGWLGVNSLVVAATAQPAPKKGRHFIGAPCAATRALRVLSGG
jgi:hypothetical protein